MPREGGGPVKTIPAALPTTAFGTLVRPARRTRQLGRAAALVLAAVLAVAAFQASRSEWTGAGASGARASAGVVVLDVSGSVQRGSVQAVRTALLGIEHGLPSNARIGLVVFSDVGGISLPATAPKSELRKVLRYFPARPKKVSVFTPTSPVSPWEGTFIGGTLISSGVAAGEDALARAGIRGGHVYLISDLADDGGDGPAMRELVAHLRREGIALTILPIPGAIDPSPFFRTLDPTVVRWAHPSSLGKLQVRPAAAASRSVSAGHPLLLAALVAAAGLLVLGCELAFPRLRFRREEVA
jgi:hypothetical protein